MTLKRRTNRPQLSQQNKLRNIRALWHRTPASRSEHIKSPKGNVEDEIDTYFNSTLFNASLHLDQLARLNKSSGGAEEVVKNLRMELRLASELGSYLIRRIKKLQ